MGPVLKMWLCSFCGKPFQHCLKRLQHRRVHSAHRPYICHVGNCTKLFSTLSGYQIHQRSHTDHRPYSCPTCRVKFLTPRHLQSHKCGARQLQCYRCLQRFHSLFSLRNHLRIKHSAVRDFSSKGRKKINVKIKFKDKYSAIREVNKTKHGTNGPCDKDGNKILLKITAGKSTTIISPKRDKLIQKQVEKHQKKKSKKKQKNKEKEKTRNGIILSIKNGSVNLPNTIKPDISKRINGLPALSTPLKQLSDLKLKIKTYPDLAIEQKDESKAMSIEVSNQSSLQNKNVTVSSEKLFQEREKTPNRKQFEELTQIPNTGESKVRNGIVILKDKSGRLQAEQLQTAKLRKRDRDNVFDSLSDMHVGIWKVMPSPRTDNPSDVLKLRLSPQKPIRLDSGLDVSYESASARYLDVALKTKVYNSGDDSDVFDAGSVIDKDSENGGPGVNDSGIEVLSSSTVRSNGNSVRSVILDESSPNYLNTEDSLLSLDSPVAEALSKSEHTLCHKCGGIIIETNNNTHSPGRCRCFVSNPNSPFQTPVSPLKMNMHLIDGSDKQNLENKKKSESPGQRKEFDMEKSGSPSLAEETSELLKLAKVDDYKSESDESDVILVNVNADKKVGESCKKDSGDESEDENKSLRLKIQLGSNPSASSVKKVLECQSPRKLSPDKRSESRSPRKLSPDKKSENKNQRKLSPDKKSESKSPSKLSPDKRTKQLSPEHKAKTEDKQTSEKVARKSSRPSPKQFKQENDSTGELGIDNITIGEEEDLDEEDVIEGEKKNMSKELFSLSRTIPHEKISISLSNSAVPENLKCELKKSPSTKPVVKTSTKENHSSGESSLQETVTKSRLNSDLPVSEFAANVSPETPESENGETMSQSEQKDQKIHDKLLKKKPLFKSKKSPLNKSEDSKSAIENVENDIVISKENDASVTKEHGTKSKYKKPLFKKRTISVDEDQSVRKSKKPLFKRTMSAIENGKTSVRNIETNSIDKTASSGPLDAKTTMNFVGSNENGSETNEPDQTQVTCDNTDEEESKLIMSKQEANDEKNSANVSVTLEKVGNVVVHDTDVKVRTCLITETEDSLQQVPTVDQEETTPASPPPLHKAVASALNPYQQQFLSFLSHTKMPDKNGKNTKLEKKANKKKLEKQNVCNTNAGVLETSSVMAEKERKKKKLPASDDEEKKSDTFSWLNIFSQVDSEKNELQKEAVPESKDEIADINEDLVAISQKMDTNEDEDSDSFDNMFESKNLTSFQPLQNPKGTWSSKASFSSTERRNVCKRKRQDNSDSELSDNSSDCDTVDLYCCHKKHDPDFNPFMDSDDDFMPAKPFKRRASVGRRAKRSHSIGSQSSDGDFKLALDSKFEDRSETSSQASRIRRSKQGRKSCCPCCLGSFRDIDEDHFGRRPSYKLPRNYKQFVKSTLRLMQLQEKIHQLFISLFPNCIDLISRVKVGTEEFDMLIEDVLFGLESQDVQFEPTAISSKLHSTQGVMCQLDGHDKTGMFHEDVADCGIPNDQGKRESVINEKDIEDHPLKSCPTDLSNQKLLENHVSDKVISGNNESSLLNSGQTAVAEENSVNCLKSLNHKKMKGESIINGDIDAENVGTVDQIVAKDNYSQDLCVPIACADSQLVPLTGNDFNDLANTVQDMEHVDHDSACDVDDNSVDMSAEVPSHLQITIDLSAARVSVCREPKNCLQRLQGQVVKLLKYLLPDLDLKNYFFRNINNLEFLVDLMIKSNHNEFQEEIEYTGASDHERTNNSLKLDSVFDRKIVNLVSEETDVKTLASVTDDNGDEIPFEQRIKLQRESLKNDVFEFEVDDTQAMIKKSESVLSNIETLSKMAKRNVRTKSRESRLRKRTAEEKRTLFVQEKVQNNHNSSIVCHSKKRTASSSRSKSFENSKQRFLSELNLGDKQGVTNSSEGLEVVDTESQKPVNEPVIDAKQDLEDMDSESRRKSSDKNIFELMQPSQAAENTS